MSPMTPKVYGIQVFPMEKQGVCSLKPRCLTGNLNEISTIVFKATLQDMKTINQDIVGRLLPRFVACSCQYGMKNNKKFLKIFCQRLFSLVHCRNY